MWTAATLQAEVVYISDPTAKQFVCLLSEAVGESYGMGHKIFCVDAASGRVTPMKRVGESDGHATISVESDHVILL